MSPTCPKPGCDSHSFEFGEITPSGANHKFKTIHCSSCGAIVGVTTVYDQDAFIADATNRLKKLEHDINVIQGSLR